MNNTIVIQTIFDFVLYLGYSLVLSLVVAYVLLTIQK